MRGKAHVAMRRYRPVVRRAGVLGWMAILAVAGSVSAHDLWLETSEAAAVGAPVTVRLMIGHGDQVETLPRRSGRILRFEAIGPGGETLPVLGLDGADPAGYFKPTVPGVWTIVYTSTPLRSELPAEAFASYLREEGLDEVAAQREAAGEAGTPGRERYRRALKLRLPVAAPGDVPAPAAPAVDVPRALPFELVDEGVDPAGRVTLRVLRDGASWANALVELRPLGGDGPVYTVRSDGSGRVAAVLAPGTWMAAAVRMDRAEAGAWASWQSVFTTLVFTVESPVPGVATPEASWR